MKSAIILLALGMMLMTTNGSAAEERVRAPEFPLGADWINTIRPLKMKELRGRAVLLDFWTYCCINCMHILPDLRKLEETYGDRLVVVGVHSAKFEGEKDTDNITDAVLRYDIAHPVLNDADFRLWRQYGVRAWPTLVLVDTEGYVVGQVSGEGNYDTLDRAIKSVLDAAGDAPSALLPIKRERATVSRSELRYPGKVLVDEMEGRLFIADSGNNRVLVTDTETGDVTAVIGSGKSGMADGAFGTAALSNPQGMVLDGHLLYIADTDNHALRVANLIDRTVKTVSGDGTQARFRAGGGNAGPNTRLNSPWDIEMAGGDLYIAMAGSHQIWRYKPDNGRIELFAGSGREDIQDGTAKSAAFAQPSGITEYGGRLYIADSETSSIRSVSVADGSVETLAGTGLFDFGHRDGPFSRARFQHPLGIVHHDGFLWVADTYNNRIRRIDTDARTVASVAGASDDGLADGIGISARLDEPGGIDAADGRLYIADTNNHEIRTLDIATGEVKTLTLKYPAPVAENGTMTVTIFPPTNFHINEAARSEITVTVAEKSTPASLVTAATMLTGNIPLTAYSAGSEATISGTVYLCGEKDASFCTLKTFSVNRRLITAQGPPAGMTILLTDID